LPLKELTSATSRTVVESAGETMADTPTSVVTTFTMPDPKMTVAKN
jgi:hypothetical protein